MININSAVAPRTRALFGEIRLGAMPCPSTRTVAVPVHTAARMATVDAVNTAGRGTVNDKQGSPPRGEPR